MGRHGLRPTLLHQPQLNRDVSDVQSVLYMLLKTFILAHQPSYARICQQNIIVTASYSNKVNVKINTVSNIGQICLANMLCGGAASAQWEACL